jgi:tetratricopeptide (TPR) repeat protein
MIKSGGALLLAAAGALSAAEWLRYSSPNFELYSDARDAVSRNALVRLELIRHVFLDTAGPRGTPLPIRVFLFASARDFRQFRLSETTRGFYQSGPERDTIAMHAGDDETYRVVFHEFVHLVLNHSAPPLPRWLEEGSAEFYSTLEARDDKLLIGGLVPVHLRTLARHPWLDGKTLASITRNPREDREPAKTGVFYAQSWALVHMLTLGPGYRTRFPRFSHLVMRGTPVAFAFEEAFSKTLDEALRDLAAYLKSGSLPVSTVLWNPLDPIGIEVEKIPPDQAETAQIELLLQMGQHAAAESRLERLARNQPDHPDVLSELAMFSMGRRRPEEARRYFERSIAAGSRRSTTYFEYAMLLRDTGAPRERVRELLQQAIGRNPRYAEAHFLLAQMQTQEGKHQEAVKSLEQAVDVLPRQSYFWHALSMGYGELDRREEARAAARRAVEAAVTEHEFEMARAALRQAAAAAARTAPAAAPAAPRPAVNVPKSWEMPKGDARVEGVLEHIDCLGQSARFHVRAEGKTLALWVGNPGQVLLNTPSSLTFEFACGSQKARRVSIEYKRTPDAARKTEGEITAIEFR